MNFRVRPLDLRRALVVVALAFSACSGGGGGTAMTGPGPDPGPGPNPPPNPNPPPPPPGIVREVRLLDSSLRFDPAELTIAPGTTVRWVHQASSIFHTVTPEGHSEWQARGRNSQGIVLEHTFQSAGEFPYFCEPHRSVGMVGAISVQ